MVSRKFLLSAFGRRPPTFWGEYFTGAAPRTIPAPVVVLAQSVFLACGCANSGAFIGRSGAPLETGQPFRLIGGGPRAGILPARPFRFRPRLFVPLMHPHALLWASRRGTWGSSFLRLF